jgi:hypothetical protein
VPSRSRARRSTRRPRGWTGHVSARSRPRSARNPSIGQT